ncbi:metallophosphoesterase family protein [Pajaroellobacter abortibovis]|uniref:Calcineurin-like phosphoesterase domain-containing protein n=1 Tax=Pajaroellobacter abortibovis TaxID=1882918 RepID=A0A1L6MX18_9BACT|nr:metallophosphoesterase [Pajaroellobacter abortibovis]APS00005.1 hypothetical protein BCY86_04370 [Pajaroellobacter abortibovis]
MRIAHVSDLHLLPQQKIPFHRLLNKRITGYINLRFRRKRAHRLVLLEATLQALKTASPDHLVITGDLTNLALESEFEHAYQFLQSHLALNPDQISIVPGNHDSYTRRSFQEKRFFHYFKEYLHSDSPLQLHPISHPFPFLHLRQGIAFIGLSSAVACPPLIAKGRIGNRQLEAMSLLLQQKEVQKRIPVLLLHHPPYPPPQPTKAWLAGLEDANKLMSRLDRVAHGIILHGHLHSRQHQIHPTQTGLLHVLGTTSASLDHPDDKKRAGFNMYELSEEGTIKKIETYILQQNPTLFHVKPLLPGAFS